jgi:hypothetical protein
METKKIECPSCGAGVEWNSSACGFCKTELRFFDEEGAVLPYNLSIEDIVSKITMRENEFWQATVNAIDAPYSMFKNFKHYNIQNFKNDFSVIPYSDCLKMFYDTFLILPNENYVGIVNLNNVGGYALLTSLRVVIFRGTTLLSIPLESIVSWFPEKSASGTNVLGRNGVEYVGQPVLRYIVGESEKRITFDPCDQYISEEVIQSVISCKEWEDIDAFQKNILRLYRYKLKKTYKLQIKPFELMDVITQPTQPKKGCFVATATMGNYNHPIVVELQHFRDHYLINKSWGKKFINFYYKNGPVIANQISKSIVLRKISLWLLIKPLTLATRLIKNY